MRGSPIRRWCATEANLRNAIEQCESRVRLLEETFDEAATALRLRSSPASNLTSFKVLIDAVRRLYDRLDEESRRAAESFEFAKSSHERDLSSAKDQLGDAVRDQERALVDLDKVRGQLTTTLSLLSAFTGRHAELFPETGRALAVSAIIEAVEREFERMHVMVEDEAHAVHRLRDEASTLSRDLDQRADAYEQLAAEHARVRDQLETLRLRSAEADDELRTLKLREARLVGHLREAYHETLNPLPLAASRARDTGAVRSHSAGVDTSSVVTSSEGMIEAVVDRLRLQAEAIGNMVHRDEYDTLLAQRDEAVNACRSIASGNESNDRRILDVLRHLGLRTDGDAVESLITALRTAHSTLLRLVSTHTGSSAGPTSRLEDLSREALETHQEMVRVASLLQRAINTVSSRVNAPQIALQRLTEGDMDRWLAAMQRAFTSRTSLSERLAQLVALCRAKGLHPTTTSPSTSRSPSAQSGHGAASAEYRSGLESADASMDQLHNIITTACQRLTNITAEWQKAKDVAARLEIDLTRMRHSTRESGQRAHQTLSGMRDAVRRKLEADRQAEAQLTEIDVTLADAAREIGRQHLDRSNLAKHVADLQRMVQHKRRCDETAELDLRELLTAYATAVNTSHEHHEEESRAHHTSTLPRH
jgi:hypothetical protein